MTDENPRREERVGRYDIASQEDKEGNAIVAEENRCEENCCTPARGCDVGSGEELVQHELEIGRRRRCPNDMTPCLVSGEDNYKGKEGQDSESVAPVSHNEKSTVFRETSKNLVFYERCNEVK